jgi:outer membrane protein TolC
MALARRVELKEARAGREIAKARESAAGNHARPKLDAYVAYSGASGNYGGLGAVHEDLAGFRNPGYTFGLTFAFPIRNREARGRRSAARADLLHQELRLRDQELSIALEVSKALRAVEAAAKGVKAAAKTRYFQEKNMDAEKQKFENGLSTNFTVLQVMTNLDSARNDELTSQIKYAKAVTAMEVAVGNLMEARNFSIR